MGEAVAEVGQTANHYQILARLATGGMAEIFLARGVSAAGVERHCVLKRILRNRASDVTFVRMFLDEARLAAQLQHPNVAQVYDIGKLGDSYFFTMEYVHGETVRAIMQRARSLRRELPIVSVLTIIAGAAAGLHHAHDRIGIDGRPLTIVHRDVSPSNLMVSYEGGVKVVDFGVAKASDRANETLSGTVKGKISYLSPEQARGSSSIDRRSDLFSLGIVMWELLTTERLYKRSSDFDNMSAIVSEAPPPPSSRKSSVPPELDSITLRLLAKDPSARFQSADELIEALESFASRNGTMISSSSLARFLRDMFGQRPEPWVEMETLEAPEGVTVTSEPIPGELAIPVGDDDDLRLDIVPKLDLEKRVPQLDDDVIPTPFIGRSIPPEELPTRPHPKVVDQMMITTLNDASPPPPRQTPPVGRLQTALPQQTIAGIGSGSQKRIPGSGPQAFIPATPGGGNREQTSGAAPAYPVASKREAAERAAINEERLGTATPSRIGWQLVSVIAIAAIVGSLTMWLVMRSRAGDPPADPAASVAQPVVSIDAAEATELDAAVAIVALDAAVEPVVEIDAAVADEPPPAPVPDKKKPEPKKPKRSEIEIAWEAGNYKDVVTRCTKSFPTNADDVKCAHAACKARNVGKARVFIAKLDKAKRKAAIAVCENNDVDLAPKPPPEKDKDKDKEKDCENNPMSCQH